MQQIIVFRYVFFFGMFQAKMLAHKVKKQCQRHDVWDKEPAPTPARRERWHSQTAKQPSGPISPRLGCRACGGWVLALGRVQKHRFGTRPHASLWIIMIFIPV